jgi:hypothetical protein
VSEKKLLSKKLLFVKNGNEPTKTFVMTKQFDFFTILETMVIHAQSLTLVVSDVQIIRTYIRT